MAFSAADVGAVLQGIGSLAQAFSIGFAAWLASNTYQNWRQQKLTERRIDQAERILSAAYNARSALRYVNTPFPQISEMEKAEEFLKTNDTWRKLDGRRQQRFKSAQVRIQRVLQVEKDRQALDECKPMARALFGADLEAALDELGRLFYVVGLGPRDIGYEINEPDRDYESTPDDVPASATWPNYKISMHIDEQIKLIERACIPVLRL